MSIGLELYDLQEFDGVFAATKLQMEPMFWLALYRKLDALPHALTLAKDFESQMIDLETILLGFEV